MTTLREEEQDAVAVPALITFDDEARWVGSGLAFAGAVGAPV